MDTPTVVGGTGSDRLTRMDTFGVIGTIVGVVSMTAAVAAAISAWSARRDVQIYKDSFWRVTFAAPNFVGTPISLRLTNTGETRALKVSIRWEMDPLGLYTDIEPLAVVGPTESFDVEFRNLNTHPGWSTVLMKPERRQGVVKWTNALGRHKTQEITFPPDHELKMIEHSTGQIA